jgi:hypothetical protein
MKFFFVMCLVLLPFTNTASAQSSTADSRNLETSGECSPISPNNQGTITIQCTGLSERQSKLILDLLRKISSRQSSDRDALMSKLDEVLATVKEAKRQSVPRVISPQKQEQIISYSSWGTCANGPVLIVAPNDDTEAQGLAVQLGRILRQVGRPADVVYQPMKKLPGNSVDFSIISNQTDPCTIRYLWGNLKDQFSISSAQLVESTPPTNFALKNLTRGANVPVQIYVYSK